MGAITDALFGGASRDAARQQVEGLKAGLESVERAREEATAAIAPLFSQAQDTRRAGYGAAFDMLGRTAPTQFGFSQQGNVKAQQQLLSGAQQAQNAILGGAIDYGQLAPQQMNAPTGTFQAPDIDLALAGQQQPSTPDVGVPPPSTGVGGGTGGAGGGMGDIITIPSQPDMHLNSQELRAAIDTEIGDYLTGLLGGNFSTMNGDAGGTGDFYQLPSTSPNPYTPSLPTGGVKFSAPTGQTTKPDIPMTPPTIPQPTTPVMQQKITSPSTGGAKKDVSLYGGEYVLNKGETLADFEARLRAQGQRPNMSMFYDIFKEKGAF